MTGSQKMRLPTEYTARATPEIFTDSVMSTVHQPLVYEFAGRLAELSNARRIVDIGCGSAVKLKPFSDKIELVCIDLKNSLEIARTQVPCAKFIEVNLEDGITNIDDSIFDDSIVICADVLEHLINPERLAKGLASAANRAKFLLISTPDRNRARGLIDNGPPSNTAHVREWSAEEFARFLSDCGLIIPFVGHTINHDKAFCKITTLILSGKESCPSQNIKPIRASALINMYNDEDIIEETVQHLFEQDVSVHIFDNWSTDQSFSKALDLLKKGLCANVERIPDKPESFYNWKKLLREKQKYAEKLDCDWCIHYDSDEIRVSPWQSVNLNTALAAVESFGYNAVDFTVIDFRFLEGADDIERNFQQSLLHFEFGRRPGLFQQIKAWKNTGPVELANSGGHSSEFPDRRIYPLKFLTKHYPLRSRSQSERKILKDRLPRIEAERAQYGWHTHYDPIVQANKFMGWDRHSLIAWHQPFFESEYLVERLSGIGLPRS